MWCIRDGLGRSSHGIFWAGLCLWPFMSAGHPQALCLLFSLCNTQPLTHSYFKILGTKGRSLCSSLVGPLPFTGLQEAMPGSFWSTGCFPWSLFCISGGLCRLHFIAHACHSSMFWSTMCMAVTYLTVQTFSFYWPMALGPEVTSFVPFYIFLI